MSVAYVVAAVSVTALAALVTPVRTQTTPPASAGPAGKSAPSVSFKSPVRSKGPTAWKCASDGAASSVVRVTFYETEPALVLLERDGVTRPAFQVRAASGARFEGDGVLFWEARGQATLNWMGVESTCAPG
jgi:membrane-bound inhibitor of C-type lysozyme